MIELLLATRNAHKTREFAQLLGNEFRVVDLSCVAAPSIEETGKTFAENAVLKAVATSRQSPGLVIADDSGLGVDVIGGAPGMYSARYAGENASDAENVDKLLRELRTANVASDQRAARFRCVIALAQDGRLRGTFEGVVEGNIVDPPRGNGGFGYDPIFRPDGFEQTFAEMEPEQKNKISHRAKAIAALREAI